MQNQLRALQILRAIAATSVVYFHIECIPKFGSFGVDIFFVISGFVMSMIIANGEGPGRFLLNRLARIVPLYWVFTTGILVIAAVRPDLLNSTTADLGNYLKSLFFIPYIKENGFLWPMLVVGWTLNYEMFFYACLWLSLIAFGKRFFLSTALLITGFCILPGHLIENRTLNLFFGDFMVFEFLAGMILYQIVARKFFEKIPALWFLFAAIAAFCFMAYMESFVCDKIPVVFGPPSVILVYSVIRLESSIDALPKWLVERLVEMGDASYATYLSHYYIVAAFRRVLHERYDLIDPYTPVGVLAIITLALIAGHFFYVFLDKPMSRWTRKRLERVINQPHLFRTFKT